jgi:trk system potassium uptake protein TrkH
MLHYGREDLKVIFTNLSTLLNASSYIFLLPILMIFIYQEPKLYIIVYLILALVMRLFSKLIKSNPKIEVERRHAVVTIILFWLTFGLFASVPFIVIEGHNFINGFYESISAMSSTGVSMFASQNALAYSSLFWRSLLEWLGGIGIVVLAIMGLFMTYSNFKLFAESEGRSDKITPNVKKTLAIFIILYFAFSLFGIVALRVAGLPLFDSMYYTFTSISGTGSDMTDVGVLGYGNEIAVLFLLLLIMFLGTTSFITHYRVFINKNLREYWKDKSLVYFIIIGLFFFFFIMLKFSKLVPLHTLYTIFSSGMGGVSLYPMSFNVNLPDVVKGIIVFMMFVGGSTASSGGGIKRQRLLLIIKIIWWKTKTMLLPKNANFQKKFDNNIVEDKTILEVLGYVLIYVLFIILGTFVLMGLGYNGMDSLMEVTSHQGNVGVPIFVDASLPLLGKIMLIINMLVGRLEIVPVLVLFGFIFNIRLKKKE